MTLYDSERFFRYWRTLNKAKRFLHIPTVSWRLLMIVRVLKASRGFFLIHRDSYGFASLLDNFWSSPAGWRLSRTLNDSQGGAETNNLTGLKLPRAEPSAFWQRPKTSLYLSLVFAGGHQLGIPRNYYQATGIIGCIISIAIIISSSLCITGNICVVSSISSMIVILSLSSISTSLISCISSIIIRISISISTIFILSTFHYVLLLFTTF